MSRTPSRPRSDAGAGVLDLAPLLVIGALTLIALLLWIWRSAELEVGPEHATHIRVSAATAGAAAGATSIPAQSPILTVESGRDARRAAPTELAVPPLPAGVVGDAWREIEGTAALIRADGSRLTLTLAPALQRPLEKRLAASRVPYAGVIVLDASTFAVRAWAEKREPGDALGAQFGLLRSTLPPGRVVGVATVAAALEAGVAPTTAVPLPGGAAPCQLGGALRPQPHALTCLGEIASRHLTAGGLLSVAEDLGFGASLPFDVAVEPSSFVIGAHELGLRRAAAGLGTATITPLHAAVLAATLAHGGAPLRPTLVAADSLQPGLSRKPERLGIGVPPAVARAITAGLVSDEVRVGAGCGDAPWPEALGDVAVAALSTHIDDYGDPAVDGDGRLVSWFLAFAPAHAPKFAVAAVAVNHERWHLKACTLGREALIHALLTSAQAAASPAALVSPAAPTSAPASPLPAAAAVGALVGAVAPPQAAGIAARPVSPPRAVGTALPLAGAATSTGTAVSAKSAAAGLDEARQGR